MIQYVLASLFTGKQQLKTMKQATRKPTTPGDILLYEYLEPLDLKINELAELLHVHRNSVSALINNNRKLTTEMAFRLAKVFDTTVDFRLNLQAAVDLWEVENNMRTLLGAFIYNSIGIPVAAGILWPFTGTLLNPVVAGAAMALSSITVVSNANRLLRFKPKE